jgi:hypothetical protein
MKILCAWVLLASSTLAVAGSETGTVKLDHGQHASGQNNAGYTFFLLEGGTKEGTPACATAYGGERWVFSNNWAPAKLQYNMLLLALATGKRVTVIGSGNCGVWWDSETAADIFIVD